LPPLQSRTHGHLWRQKRPARSPSARLAKYEVALPRSVAGRDAQMPDLPGGIYRVMHWCGRFGFDGAMDSDSHARALPVFADLLCGEILSMAREEARGLDCVIAGLGSVTDGSRLAAATAGVSGSVQRAARHDHFSDREITLGDPIWGHYWRRFSDHPCPLYKHQIRHPFSNPTEPGRPRPDFAESEGGHY
jgi:hypothetical protein